jgi:methylated-DNA-[protein]-cysteine S-methyltransferase
MFNAAALTAQATVSTPLGPVLLARTALGLSGTWFEDQRWHPGPLAAPVIDNDPLLRAAACQLTRYFEGHAEDFSVPLDLDSQGTPFQRSVWAALRRLPRGQTCSYAALAQALGRAGAARAVGAAVGRNPISVIVPCHRVLGAQGALTGYAGGLARKVSLLALERLPAA